MAFLHTHMPFTSGWMESNNNFEESHELVPSMPRWKRFARLVLPHVGLVALSFLYIVGGAVFFFKLERPHEVHLRNTKLAQLEATKLNMTEEMDKLLKNNSTTKDEREAAAKNYVEQYTRQLFEAFDTHYITSDHINKEKKGNKNDDSEIDNNWTFLTSLFFTTTLLTTIGYGNLVPATQTGKMFCVCYALLGVPLILITVADIGKFLSENITWCYKRYHSKRGGKHEPLLNTDANDNDDKLLQVSDLGYVAIPVWLIVLILIGYICMGACLFRLWESDWSFFQGFYFAFITMTTVGFGDIVPVNKSYFLVDLMYIIIGLAITTMCIDLVGISYIKKIHYFGRAIKDARFALVNVGGKMVHVPDLMRYASVLHQKYGKKHADMIIKGAYTPKDIARIRFIDYTAFASCDSIATLLSNLCGSGGKGKDDHPYPEDV